MRYRCILISRNLGCPGKLLAVTERSGFALIPKAVDIAQSAFRFEATLPVTAQRRSRIKRELKNGHHA